MPRRRRIIPINEAMHIICRGNNKQRIFLGNKDKSYYYSLLRKYKEENRITIKSGPPVNVQNFKIPL